MIGIAVLRKDSGSSTLTYQSTLQMISAYSIEVADVDGDSIDDLVAVTNTNDLMVYYGYRGGSSTFTGNTLLASSLSSDAIGIIDSNQDGRNEIVINTATGIRTFSIGQNRTSTSTTQTGVSFDAIADLNFDGYLDLVDLTNAGVLKAHYGQASGTYGSATTLGTMSVSSNGTVSIADINGDGLPDIIAGGEGVPNSRLGVFLGNDQGGYTKTFDQAVGSQFRGRPQVNDLNGDGVLDILIDQQVLLPVTTSSTVLTRVNLLSAEEARNALNTISSFLDQLNDERSALGAARARAASMAEGLLSTSENFTAARSRIIDADIAQETASLVRLQISQQAAAAVSSQANLIPRLVLDLLKNP